MWTLVKVAHICHASIQNRSKKPWNCFDNTNFFVKTEVYNSGQRIPLVGPNYYRRDRASYATETLALDEHDVMHSEGIKQQAIDAFSRLFNKGKNKGQLEDDISMKDYSKHDVIYKFCALGKCSFCWQLPK